MSTGGFYQPDADVSPCIVGWLLLGYWDKFLCWQFLSFPLFVSLIMWCSIVTFRFCYSDSYAIQQCHNIWNELYTLTLMTLNWRKRTYVTVHTLVLLRANPHLLPDTPVLQWASVAVQVRVFPGQGLVVICCVSCGVPTCPNSVGIFQNDNDLDIKLIIVTLEEIMTSLTIVLEADFADCPSERGAIFVFLTLFPHAS